MQQIQYVENWASCSSSFLRVGECVWRVVYVTAVISAQDELFICLSRFSINLQLLVALVLVYFSLVPLCNHNYALLSHLRVSANFKSEDLLQVIALRGRS